MTPTAPLPLATRSPASHIQCELDCEKLIETLAAPVKMHHPDSKQVVASQLHSAARRRPVATAQTSVHAASVAGIARPAT